MKKETEERLKQYGLVLAIITGVLTILTGALSFREYYASVERGRVERALSYGEQFRALSTETFQLNRDYSQWYLETLRPKLQELKDPSSLNDVADEEVIKWIYQTPQRALTVAQLIDLYDELALCVQEELCDFGTVKKFYGHTSKLLNNNYYPYIKNAREESKDESYGAGVEYLADM